MSRFGVSIVDYVKNKWITEYYYAPSWKSALLQHSLWPNINPNILSDDLQIAKTQAQELGVTMTVWGCYAQEYYEKYGNFPPLLQHAVRFQYTASDTTRGNNYV